jgi:hypothetical protein
VHAIGLLGLLHRGTRATHSSRNRGCDNSPSFLPHHTRWIDVVDMWVQSPLIVSGVLRSLDGEMAEALSTLRTIPGVGSEWPFWFSPTVQIARCRSTHLALLIFSELGQKLPFLTIDLKGRHAPLPVMASGGDHGERACGGSPHRNHRQPLSCQGRMNASSSRASPSARWVFTLCQRLPGLASLV